MIKIYKQLQNNTFFKDINIDDIKPLINGNTTLTSFNNNQYIIHEQDPCDFIAFVLEGQVLIQKQFIHGDVLTINMLEKNAAFGGALLFATQHNFHYSVTSKNKSTILFINKKAILELLSQNQVFNKNYIKFLSDRLYLFQNLVNILRLKDVRSKLVIYLQSERQKNSNDSFVISNSREEIANIIGVTRPSVSRELIHMQQDGVITISKRNVTLLTSDLWLLPPL